MSLRILHVLQQIDSDAGRSAEAVCELSLVQRQFGHTVEITVVGSSGGNAFDHLGIPIHHIDGGWGAYGYDSGFVPWMKERAGRYDCVIVHGIWDYCGLGTSRALQDSAVPYFVFTHGMLDPWFKLHQPIRHLIRWLYWPWGGYPVLRDAHAVFFLCEDERRRAREAFWLYDCHEFVVRFGTSGIPREIAGSVGGGFVEAHPLLRGKRLFTFLADHNPAEGIYTIVKAIESLFQMGVWNPESMRLVIAGNASGTTKDILRQILGKSRFDESVYLAGALREREMWCALRESEVFLRPSSYEICGKQVAKSLSAGTPVLMSTGVAIWKDIVNDGAGFAGDETAEGFSAMLRRWISLSDDEHDTFRLAARKCFEARYTLIGAAHTLTSAIYLLVGVHRDSRWDLKPLKPASELA